MIYLLVATLIGASAAADTQQILRQWSREVRSEEFVAPSPVEFAGMRDLMRLALQGDPASAWARAPVLGFQVDHLLGDEMLVVLRDSAKARGGGFYAFRNNAAGERDRRSVVVQAPHAFYDGGTGLLATRVFAATHAKALCLNTAQRYVAPNADVAHAEPSYFQAVTEAACAGWPDAAVLQLHGYARSKHEELPDTVWAVVSDGSEALRKPELMRRVADGLTGVFGAHAVAIYPRDTDSLGGTLNVQGRHILRHTDDTFIHLELSREARDLLAADADAFAAFVAVVDDLTRR
jgi:hypothetical protein